MALSLALPVAASAFTHPGLLNNSSDYAFIRAKLKAGAQPWKDAYGKIPSSASGSLSYKPHPAAHIECGRYSNPNRGCSEETSDGIAAYTHALIWILGGETAHARKAIEILNAWPPVLKDHTLANATLQAGWAGSSLIRAAEIIRHSDAGWATDDIERFSAMLRNVYLRDLTRPQSGVDGLISIFGNWDLTITEGITSIGVFLDDEAVFQKGLERWRRRMPAYIYLSADGPKPVPPPDAPAADDARLIEYWFGQSTFRDGVTEETCRDLGHFQYGLGAAADVAEIAWNQGVDLYAEASARFLAAMEFQAGLLTGNPVPAWLCQGKVETASIPTWEIAYNHFANRLGKPLPNSRKLILKSRPSGTYKHMVWETLTHGELGTQGRVPAASGPRTELPALPMEGSRGPKLRFAGAGQPVLMWEPGPGRHAGRSLGIDGKARPVP